MGRFHRRIGITPFPRLSGPRRQRFVNNVLARVRERPDSMLKSEKQPGKQEVPARGQWPPIRRPLSCAFLLRRSWRVVKIRADAGRTRHAPAHTCATPDDTRATDKTWTASLGTRGEARERAESATSHL